MYELKQVGERSFYIESPAKIGLFLINDTEVYLIDSGNDKDAGRRVRKLLDENGWTLKGILNTHSHADHIGGNDYLQRQYNCKIFCDGIESSFTKYPVLEPSYLYGGYPFKEIRHKFFMAASSDTVSFDDPDFPSDFEVIRLPGHTFDMVGFRTPDDTVYLADSLSSEATLNKYQITFLYDVQGFLDTLDMLEGLHAKMYVPSHTEAMRDITGLIELNRNKIHEIAEQILQFCNDRQTFESLLTLLFDHYNLPLNSDQYVLVGSTIKSYLSWLKDNKRIEIEFENNTMYWKSV